MTATALVVPASAVTPAGTELDSPPVVPGYADHWPTPRQRHGRRKATLRWALMSGVLLVSLLLAVVVTPALALVPVFVVLGAWALVALPFGLLTPMVVGILLSTNAPGLHPSEDRWRSPLYAVGKILYTVMPIKLAVADILIGALVVRAVMVIVLNDWGSGRDRRPPRPFAQAALVGLGAILTWTVIGIGTGGSFKNMLWQVRPLMWMPCFAIAASVAAATRQGIARFRTAILVAGVVKAIEGIYFYFGVAKPRHLDVAYVTTHSDSVLWAVATAIVIADWVEERNHRTRRNIVLLIPFYALGMVLNNRRTVWVSVFASIAFIATVAQQPVKRQLARILGVTWPLLILYVAVGLGTHSPSIVFKPVSMIDSVLFQTDASSSTRDIENYNLLVTLKARPFLGWGFGHEYIEASKAYDISKGFAQYRYIPHNSFLGLWAFLGPVGAGGYFLLPVVAVFYAVGTRRRTRDPLLRSAGAWAVCAVIAYLVQGWADIGLQDWTAIVCVGVGFGISGALPRHVRRTEDQEVAREVAREVDAEGGLVMDPTIARGRFPSDSPLASLG